MGILIDGVWGEPRRDPRFAGGRFIRAETQFRSWITPGEVLVFEPMAPWICV